MILGGKPSPPRKQLFPRLLLLGCLITWVFARPDEDMLLDVPANTGIGPSMDISLTPSCWIYTHLQKSGGSTIKRIIKKRGVRFPQPCANCSVYYTIYDSEQWKRGNEWTEDFSKQLGAPGEVNVAMGGYTEALRASSETKPTCRWFTQFRHPIPRLVSAFFYCKTKPGDQLCASNGMPPDAHSDIMAFAKHWGNFAVRQFALGVLPIDGKSIIGAWGSRFAGWYLQKRYMIEMSGYGQSDPEPDEAMSHILKTVQDVLQTYAAVGILEEFNTTLSLYDAVLDIPGVRWAEEYRTFGIANADKTKRQEEEEALADAWTNAELKRYIRLDLLLYEHALDVFRQQVETHGIA